MRIVMLSCNTGEGHNSTAKAIEEVLSARGVECEIIDVLSCLSPAFSKVVCAGHAGLYKYAPKLWDVGYRAFENVELGNEDRDLLANLLAFGAPKLRDRLVAGKYDAAVCVHVFSGMMMTTVREELGYRIPSYFVATDYTCSPYADECRMDGYFIPAAGLVGEFTAVKLPQDKLIPSGIPVRQSFYSAGDPAEARRALQLPEKGVCVLLMCGSMGCGPMRKIAKELMEQLPEDAFVVAVCGKNEKLYETLSDIENPRMRVLGYCDRMQTYMDAADLIVTKPGGLSSTEAGNKHLPMVFINAVGGCESRNFDFFLNRGYAVGSADPEKVVALTAALAGDAQRRREMKETLRKGFSKNSAQIIADTIMLAENPSKLSDSTGIKDRETVHPPIIKGGICMDQKASQTVINLARSFAGESQARMRYDIYAAVARKEKQEWIARVFEETAKNEMAHARAFLRLLKKLGAEAENIDIGGGYPYPLGNTAQNLQAAAEGEEQEFTDVYPAFAETARQEGFGEAAQLWENIALIEGVHRNNFTSLKEQLNGGTLIQKDAPVMWRCLNCGYTYESTSACAACPVCGKDASWQEGILNRKDLPGKK